MHLSELRRLGTHRISCGHCRFQLLDNRLFKRFFRAPFSFAHAEQPFVRGIYRSVTVALARLFSVAHLVGMHSTPALQMRQHRAHKRHRFVARHARVFGQARRAILDHGVHRGFVGIFSLFIAPFTVMLIFGAVSIGAVIGWHQNHAAALTIALGQIEQMYNGLVEHVRDELHHVDARHNLAAFPARHRLPRHVQLRRKPFLRQALAFAQLNQFC